MIPLILVTIICKLIWLRFPADSVIFTGEIFIGKLFLCGNITCVLVETVQKHIQKSLCKLPWSELSLKRSQGTVTLAILDPSIRVNNQTVVIDPFVLFSRLVDLMQVLYI